ncbi:hypothetical protein GAY21_23545 [Phocaeicola vulgatus]|nr:hypothetical protein GAY21_23545 [Phocaeicola vulgatus]
MSRGKKKKQTASKTQKKKWNWLNSAIVVGVATAVLTLVGTLAVPYISGDITTAQWQRDKAYAYHEESLQKVYYPVQRVLVMKEQITVQEYISLIEEVLNGNELYLGELNNEFLLLKKKHLEDKKIQSDPNVPKDEKEQKKAELGLAVRNFHARLNEQYVNHSKWYQSMVQQTEKEDTKKGEQNVTYYLLQIEIVHDSYVKITSNDVGLQ